MPQAVVLTADEWTPESGVVTAAQKVQRRKVAERFDAEIKEARRRHSVRGNKRIADTARSLLFSCIHFNLSHMTVFILTAPRLV
ncbi:hypothetical protein EDB86DRAFT_2944935 [Lactarius hatsudake]|nr:hypothetical protein EDB86DRAFT_2944935 [Lactarius hatsudake]